MSNLRVDVPVSRLTSLTRGRRNNLRENTHFHHCQLWVPGLHVHLVPCLNRPFCSVGPHSFLLKNSSLCLVGTAPIYCDLADAFCLLHAPCHTHWKGHTKPLSDLTRETPSHLRSFITLKRILFGKFHVFSYHVSKTWLVCNVERNAVFIKERCYHSTPFFGSWLLWSFQWKQTILQFVTVKYCQTLYGSAASLFRLLKIMQGFSMYP